MKEDAFLWKRPTNASGSAIANHIQLNFISKKSNAKPYYDIKRVQPNDWTTTGLIFAMRSRFTSQTGNEEIYLTKQTQISLVEIVIVAGLNC